MKNLQCPPTWREAAISRDLNSGWLRPQTRILDISKIWLITSRLVLVFSNEAAQSDILLERRRFLSGIASYAALLCRGMTVTTDITGGSSIRPHEFEVESLAERFRSGNIGAFDELVELYQPWASRLAARFLGWSQDTADIVQDVFISVFEHLPRFRRECRFSTWVARITINHCRRRQRKSALRQALQKSFWNAHAGKLAAAEMHRDRMKQLLKIVTQLHTAKQVGQLQVLTAQYYSAEAKLLLIDVR